MNQKGKKKKIIIPKYCIVPLLFSFLYNNLVYVGCRLIAGGWPHHQLLFSWEEQIPLVPWTVAIYFGCYLFWAVNYILIGMQGREYCYRFCAGDVLSRTVCALCFLIYPTTIVRPEITGTGLWNELLRFLYSVDAADNLFSVDPLPGELVLFCGNRGRKEIPRWYRIVSCIAALAVCVSVLTTKQHGAIDIAGGVVLAEICFWIGMHTNLYRYHKRWLEPISARIFGKENG